ncbi:TetR/AcrR family transcriptional regulator [Allonocardiopsis opalescens]|uniref:TetR family transcriptional regulator n=1 Tax=Allonocardiopsis opalescens TaxID=1144618 RepID=A0A2T0Q5F7_9ACTN|nr:TetR/AcrR family transcriptional regulator [Allonocardiopsis opalescens]PRX99024.1 TetR family transcriptional regulator [Allonocardiopsis opalescens]
MVRRPALRDRISAGILDTAASVLAERGDSASMADIAETAGVSRATLYRYFPSRDALLAGMAQAAMDDLDERIAGAELDGVPVREGIARLTRAFLAAGGRYAALIHIKLTEERKRGMLPESADERVAGPVRRLIERGVADGSLRADVPADVQFELFTALVERALRLVSGRRLGVEQASAAVVAVFLDGAGGAQRD